MLAIVVYSPAPWGDLVWDDVVIFERQIVAINGFTEALLPPDGLWGWTYVYYRPMVVLSYLADVGLYGNMSAAGPHLSNVVYHVIATFFVWLLARRFFVGLPNTDTGAVVAAAIFAVHPIHTESVNWIAGRGDMLATLFLLPGIGLALVWRDRRNGWALFAAAALYFLALLSKELAVSALILVPAALILVPQNDDREKTTLRAPTPVLRRNAVFICAATFAAYFVATLLYVGLRSFAATGGDGGLPLLSWARSASDLASAGAYYVIKVLWPWPQSNMVTWDMLPGLASALAVLLFAAVLVAIAVRRWIHGRDGILSLAVLWFAASLVPSLLVAVANVARTETGPGMAAAAFPVAERYLYLPSVGLALMLGWMFCLAGSANARRIAMAIAVVIVMGYSIATFERGMVWNNNVRLWTDTTEKVPNHGSPWNQLGRAYFAIGDDEKALPAFERAVQLLGGSESRFRIDHNIGTIYLRERDLETAEMHFRRALQARKELAEPHYGLGLIYTYKVADIYDSGGSRALIRANVDLAVGHYQSAIRINPDFYLARLLLARILVDYGQLLVADGRIDQAIAMHEAARSQINSLLVRIPQDESEQFNERWRAQVNIDVYELQARNESALTNLRQ